MGFNSGFKGLISKGNLTSQFLQEFNFTIFARIWAEENSFLLQNVIPFTVIYFINLLSNKKL